jgi:hypothetical protein
MKPLFIVFVGGLKKNKGSGRTIDAGAIVEKGFAQGPEKLNDGSGKTNYPGTIDRGFTVHGNSKRCVVNQADLCWKTGLSQELGQRFWWTLNRYYHTSDFVKIKWFDGIW